ncbi:MAG: peptide chain release factor aRF-1 [Thermoplasmata archaeon]
MTDVQIARYAFKKKLEEIKECKGRATELISLYVPPGRQISDVLNYLRNEYAQSSNIKSRTTRKNVMWAIESLMNKVKMFKEPPSNGVVFFVGTKAVGADQSEPVSFVIEPPEPINIYMYRCDSFFYTEPLESMLLEKDLYGLVVIDRAEATVGLLRGKRITVVKNKQSLVPSKHGRGGQSQHRFERLIEQAAHEFYVKVAEICAEAFLPVLSELKGILVGGPGATKEYFINEGYLHHELMKKVIKPFFDTGYTDEYGLKELVEKASEVLADLDLMKEKKLVQRFLTEVRKPNGGLAVYGEKEVRDALQNGYIDTLLVSEALQKMRVSMRCKYCGYAEDKTLPKELVPSSGSCPKCNAVLEIKSTDIVEEISAEAEKYGTKVEIISDESEEGQILINAFGGIAGILRYAINK